ncbi:response regulator [Ramlibacter ginsenosidimutans]|uniref:Response regulator n=1 Tax=Ramlibacter ginsenosidimutans TaxID=502333 RepID=A0A934TXA4_9BURK|nr:response regulator [Ramlibacter ginsenosidimutans]MBK6008996.1 response regulator [Ramlibacter ginsenosidimutans]
MAFRAYIVEDSSTIRDNLVETLKELAQFEPVGSTASEHEAKRWLAANAWDLAIIDLFLREGSGMNVLEACRGREPGQKVVVLSNHSSRDVRWRCQQLGADACFDKSTELEALVAYCRKLRDGVQPQLEAAPTTPGTAAPA